MNLTGDARTLWDAAVALNRAALSVRGGCGRALPPLLFFTDPDRTPESWRTAERLPAGAGVVYRHFGAADAEATARRLRSVTTARGVVLLIGLDADLADRVGADGVHLPERVLSSAGSLRTRRPDWLLTGSAHSTAAAATAEGLDALLLSPIFPAGGMSASRPALGLEALIEAVARAACPVYALGGIGAANAGQLSGSGACGIAGVEAIRRAFSTADPRT